MKITKKKLPWGSFGVVWSEFVMKIPKKITLGLVWGRLELFGVVWSEYIMKITNKKFSSELV